MHVKFRTIVDLSWATLGHFLMVGVAVYDPENGIYLSAYGMLFNSIVFLLLHYAYFNYVLTNQDVSTTPKGMFAMVILCCILFSLYHLRSFFFISQRMFHTIQINGGISAKPSTVPY